jgi:hypothetical protein
MVWVHQISEQFCCSGVTGMIAARMGSLGWSVMGVRWKLAVQNAICSI